ncbi:hypothetical protein EMGBS14_06850 [Candidatus Pelagibacterales bacterium]|nr:hypothetical protein EMGBS14_06850 [Pelagibacterales bacterium]
MTEDFINYYRENISKKSQIIKGVNDFLVWGKSQKINFAICTNKMESLAKNFLKKLILLSFLIILQVLIPLNIENQIQDI